MVHRRFGTRGALIAVLVVSVVSFLGYNLWDPARQVLKSEFYKWKNPVPTAAGDKFSVAIAFLAGDPDNSQRRRLVAGMEDLENLRGVELLDIPRVVEIPLGSRGRVTQEGDLLARDLLQGAKADLMIWGEVLTGNPKSLRIYCTSSEQQALQPANYVFPTTIGLPDGFADDIAAALRVLVVGRFAAISRPGQYSADELEPYVVKLRTLLHTPSPYPDTTVARMLYMLAIAQQSVGQQVGDNGLLKEAVASFRRAIEKLTTESEFLLRSEVRTSLAQALGDLSVATSNSLLLEDGVFECRLSLAQLKTNASAFEWSRAHLVLGNLLGAQYEVVGRLHLLQESISAYETASQSAPATHANHLRAASLNNLGISLAQLHEREPTLDLLMTASSRLREALLLRPRALVPVMWANSKHNLGGVLIKMGTWHCERGAADVGRDTLAAAVNTMRGALQVRLEDKAPVEWAESQASLGNAFIAAGLCGGGDRSLRSAVVALRGASGVFHEKSRHVEEAKTLDMLGVALCQLGKAALDTVQVLESIVSIRTAMGLFEEKGLRFRVAKTSINLSNAYGSLWSITRHAETLAQSVAHALGAWRVLTELGGHEAHLAASVLSSGLQDAEDANVRDQLDELLDPENRRLLVRFLDRSE